MLELTLYAVKDKICAWEMHDRASDELYSGAARPFKSGASLDKLTPSELLSLPYTKKQLRSMEYIGSYASYFKKIFEQTDQILPQARYDNAFKHTFGAESDIYRLYQRKALPPANAAGEPALYIDFEAMNMRICGWYAELVSSQQTEIFEGTARPYSDPQTMKRLWRMTYGKLLPYSLEQLLESEHIRAQRSTFLSLFKRAKKIYTYGDTDALFVRHTFGEDLYHLFKIKNVDASLKIGARVVSLDKACHLFGIEAQGQAHNPKFDVYKMRAYWEAAQLI